MQVRARQKSLRLGSMGLPALLTAFGVISGAQADPARGKENWVISGEGLGRSFYSSINVDRSIGERWSVGGGYGSAWNTPSLSVYGNAYLAGEYLSFYITGGVTGYFSSGYAQWFAWPGAGAELRLHAGPTIRATVYLPVGLDNFWTVKNYFTSSSSALFLWPGLSFGWCF